MTDRVVDRQAWAGLLKGLIASEARGKKAPFARIVGVSERSLTNWLTGAVDVSEESVRKVASALGRPALELLVEVGYYSADEVGAGEPTTVLDVDEEIRRVRESGLPPRVQARIVATILEMQRADAERRTRMVDVLIEQAKGA